MVALVAPKATDVDPNVTELYCRDEFGTFDSDIVFVPPSDTGDDPVMPPE